MKLILQYLVLYMALALLIVLFSDCNPNTNASDTTAEAFKPLKHVIVIGVDGMSPDGIRNAPTPNMDHMMEQGAYTLRARGVLPTSSSPNWASMVMGVGPEQHGVTSNSWERDDHILPPVVAGKEGIAPTIFSIVREQHPQAEIGAIYHWEGFGRLIEATFINKDQHVEGETETTLAAIDYIKSAKPELLFIHLDHVDHAGHSTGHGTPEYYTSVAKADSLIGMLMKACEDAGIMNETLILVTSDHGGLGNGHGGETLDEIEIPFILYGAGVKTGFRIDHTVYTYDNAATVAFALGVDQPYSWIGRPVKAAFEGFDAPDTKGQEPPVLSPIIYPKREGYKPAGGLFTNVEAEVRIDSREPGTIYYTVDGSIPNASSPEYNAPFTVNKTCIVQAITIAKDGRISRTADAYFRFVPNDDMHGVKYSYFEGDKMNWRFIPNFGSYKPLRTGVANEIRHDQIGDRRPEGHFGAVFEGFVKIDSAGTYRFYTASDDGSIMYVNGTQVVDNDGDHGTIERSGDIDLEAGYYPLKVEWFNGGGGYWLDVYYRGPGVPKQIIPANKLYKNKPAI